MSKQQELMLKTITRWHDGQKRGDLPVTVHCRNVAAIAHFALQAERVEDDLLDDVIVAALGHDLLEDTYVSRQELYEQFGERVLGFIELLTNHQDDYHTDEYMEQIQSAPEEVRIIKYGDLIDNIASVNYSLHQLGSDWGNNFFSPIMNKTLKMLQNSRFSKYPEAAARLDVSAQLFASLLRANLSTMSKQ